MREVAWAKFVVVVLHPTTQIKVESGPMNSFVRVRKVVLQIDTANICNVPVKRGSRKLKIGPKTTCLVIRVVSIGRRNTSQNPPCIENKKLKMVVGLDHPKRYPGSVFTK